MSSFNCILIILNYSALDTALLWVLKNAPARREVSRTNGCTAKRITDTRIPTVTVRWLLVWKRFSLFSAASFTPPESYTCRSQTPSSSLKNRFQSPTSFPGKESNCMSWGMRKAEISALCFSGHVCVISFELSFLKRIGQRALTDVPLLQVLAHWGKYWG